MSEAGNELKIYLYEYCFSELGRAQDNLDQWRINLSRNCNPDEIDYLELILALNRYNVTLKIVKDMLGLLRTYGN